MEAPRGCFVFRMLAAFRVPLPPLPRRRSTSAASCRIRSFVTPRAFAVARAEGYGVSILAFFTNPNYAAVEALVNSPRPRGHLPWIHPIEELRPPIARPRPGMLAQHALVDVGAPARRVGEPDVSIADHRRARDERPL